jgi:hypothetical protein
MSRLSKVVKQYPLISFSLLTFALSWWKEPSEISAKPSVYEVQTKAELQAQ